MSVHRAIKQADRTLPGKPVLNGEENTRWQAVIKVGEYVETNPEEVWQFVRKWGPHAQADLRMAIACCLLEHLLEHHFDLVFPRVQKAVAQSGRFADTFSHCWKGGQPDRFANAPKFDALQRPVKQWLRRQDRKSIPSGTA